MDIRDLVSVDRRRRRWRPKPIAVMILVVAGLLLVGLAAWGASQISRAQEVQPLVVDATSTPTPATSAHPVTWSVRLDRDADGKLIGRVDDPAVKQAIVDGFLEAFGWTFQSEVPHNPADAGRYFAPLPEGTGDWVFEPDQGWWFGLEHVQEMVERERDPGVLSVLILKDGAWRVEIVRFSTDGRLAVVKARYEGGVCNGKFVNVATGEVMTAIERPCAQYTAGMVYDTSDGRWKIATLRQYFP